MWCVCVVVGGGGYGGPVFLFGLSGLVPRAGESNVEDAI